MEREPTPNLDDQRLGRYPRAVDDRTLYNVPGDIIDRVREFYPWPEGADIRLITSVLDPPPLGEEESGAAHEAAHGCVVEYLEQYGISRWDELNEEIFSPLDLWVQGQSQSGVSLDRTLNIVLTEPRYFTPAFIDHFHSCFLKARPLWRAGICNSIDEEDVTIYPDVVRVGNVLCPPADVDVEVRRWQERITQSRAPELEARQREIRQFRYLKDLVQQSLGQVCAAGLLFLAAFENAERKREEYWYTVAALVADPSRAYVALSPEPTYHWHEYPVSANGRIGKRGGGWFDEPYRMLQFILPKLANPILVLAEGNSFQERCESYAVPGGRRWSFQIRPETLITDEELKRMEAVGELE